MKKALMYGAGNIGRGFIGKRFYLSGYHTVFVDVNADMVEKLRAAGKYPIYVTKGTEYVPEWVENCTAVNGRDDNAVIDEIASCDIMATALGVNVLPHVASLIARGLLARRERTGKPLNILICENLIGSDKYLRGLVEPFISEEAKSYFLDEVGFVSVSVGITVPPTPEKFLAENPLAVCTDLYRELPANALGFRPVGAPTPEIDGMVVFSPFDFFIERKLLIHNMGHALMAYLGYLKKYNYIYEVAADGEIKYILTRALVESARALAKRHGANLDDVMTFVETLIPRLDNPLLEDTLFRVGRDPKRKLGAGDRLGGAYLMVREQGGIPAHIAVGIAAGYLFDCPEDPIALEVSSFARKEGLAAALEKYSGITAPEDVAMITEFYNMLDRRAPFAEFVTVLNKYKTGMN
ncbi:mannitol-1-phosphate 5-dehydrogenase [Anaerotruncus sp. CAG:390]|nr:mannitol-1-phosphate 5-dehydrogenase [Anaerotruncus sp. CAG:390]